ncbi:hypothetical protein Bbelb_191550 [Branchiostoma belcheri]|nr:hypothetical protein Bbelb_191550 [Branchiostoma belcheri]
MAELQGRVLDLFAAQATRPRRTTEVAGSLGITKKEASTALYALQRQGAVERVQQLPATATEKQGAARRQGQARHVSLKMVVNVEKIDGKKRKKHQIDRGLWEMTYKQLHLFKSGPLGPETCPDQSGGFPKVGRLRAALFAPLRARSAAFFFVVPPMWCSN